MADDPYEWVRDLTRCVDDKLVQDLVADFRNYKAGPSGGTPATVQIVGAGRTVTGTDTVVSGGTGWVEAPKVDSWRPPGIDLIDQMVSAQDAVDQVQRIKELAEAAAVQRALSSAEPESKEPEPKARKGLQK
jgi:hypothetical protein